MVRRARGGVVQLCRDRTEQRVVHQRRFARARYPGNAGHASERKFGGDILEIVGRRTDDADASQSWDGLVAASRG